MPYMLYNSTGPGVSRFNHKDEDTVDLRQSVSVQMKIRVEDTSHSADSSFGITLYGLNEFPDTLNNVGKKLRILSPTIIGSDNMFKVMLDDTVVSQVSCALMNDSVENLVEYRFWQDTANFKVEYYLNSVLTASRTVPKTVLTDTLKFRVGVTLTGTSTVNIYTLDINRKDKVARTVRLQGNSQISIPDGNTSVLLKGTGGPGRYTTFKISKTLTSNVHKLISGSSLVDDVPDTAVRFEGVVGRNSHCILLNTGRGSDDISPTATSYFNCKTTDLFDTIEKVVVPAGTRISNCVVLNDEFYFKYQWTGSGVDRPNPEHIFKTYDFETVELVWEAPSGFTSFRMHVKFVEGVGDVLLVTNNSSTAYYTSVDGSVFTERTAAFSISGDVLVSAGGVYLETDHNQRSTNLIDWEDYTAPSVAVQTANGNLKYTYPYGNGIIAYKRNGQNEVRYSLDSGDTWLEYIHPVAFTSLVFGNGLFVLYAADGLNTSTYTTKDFVDVNEVVGSSGTLGGKCFFEINKFIVIKDTTAVFKISADFQVWEEIISSPKLQPRSSTYFYVDDIGDYLVLRPDHDSSPNIRIVQANKASSIAGLLLNTRVGVGTSEDGVQGSEVTATIGGQTYNFPTTKSDQQSPVLSRPVSVPLSNVTVNYVAPVDAVLEITYIDDQYSGPTRNGYLRDGCVGVDKVQFFNDGADGEYISIVSKNSPDCGYVADTLKTVVLTGQGTLEIPAGLTTLEVNGRGSSTIPKTLDVTYVDRKASFDRLTDLPIAEVTGAVYGNGLYVLLCDNDTASGHSYPKARQMWVGASLDTLQLMTFPNAYRFTYAHYFGGKLLVQVQDDLTSRLLVCSTGGTDDADWSLVSSTVIPVAALKLNVTPTHLVQMWGQLYVTSTDGTTFDKRNWTGYSYVRHGHVGVVVTDSGVVISYGNTSANLDTGPYGQDWVLMTYGENSLDNNLWTPRSAQNGYDSGSSDPEELANYAAVDQILRANLAPSTRRGIVSMAFGNGICYGIVGYAYGDSDYGTDQQTYNKTNDYAPGFEVRVDVVSTTVYCVRGPFGPKASVVFTDGQFIVVDRGRVYTSTDTVTWEEAPLFDSLKNKIVNVCAFNNNVYYRTAIPGIIYSSKKFVNDQYVTKLPVPGEDAVITVGDSLLRIPGNPTSSAAAPTVTEEFTLNPATPTVVVYDCPPGSLVSIEYMSVNDGAPIAGTLIGTICDGFNQNGIYANGVGGTYNSLIEANAVDCGYTAPVVRANVNYAATFNIVETQTKEIVYNLNQPLDVDVGFVFSMNFVGSAEASDFENIRFAVGNDALAALSVDDVITVPAGITNFKIVLTATEDFRNEVVEATDFILTPSVNPERIINSVISTTVSMTSNNMLVNADSFNSNTTNGITSNVFYYKPGAGFTNSERIVTSSTNVVSGRYAIEIIEASYENLLIGFGTSETTLYNGGAFVWPGQDEYSWGFCSFGNYHNGTLLNSGPSWTGANTKLTLLVDLVAGTAEMLVNGMSVGNVFTGLPADLYLMIGVAAPGTSASFYLNMGQFPFSAEAVAGIPDGYYHGFGYLTEESNWSPEYSPAITDSGINPSGMTGPTEGSVVANGVVKIHSTYRSQTVVPLNDGNGQVEIIVLSTDLVRIGIHSNTFSGVAGTTADSWAIMSNGLAAYHNGVETVLDTPSAPVFIISIIIDLIGRLVRVNFGDNYTTVFTGLPTQTDLVVSVATTKTLANGGSHVFVNCGQSSFQNSRYEYNQGIGTLIGNPVSGAVISSYCASQDLMVTLADGSGGTTSQLYAKNSTICGYTPPADNVSGFAYALKGEGGHYNSDGTIVEFTKEATLVGHAPAGAGKLYWEVKSNDVYVGVAGPGINTDTDTSGNQFSFFLSLRDGYVNRTNWIDALSAQYADEMLDKWVGFMLDLDASKLSVKFESGTIVQLIDFNTAVTGSTLRMMISADGAYSNVLVNQGQTAFNNGLPVGYSTWFDPLEMAPLYVDDFENNPIYYTGLTDWADFFNVITPGATMDVNVEYVNDVPGEGYLSIKKPANEFNDIRYWIWPYEVPHVAQIRATYVMEIPNHQIRKYQTEGAGGEGYYPQFVPAGTVLTTDDLELYMDSIIHFSVFGETNAVRNEPLKLTLRHDGTYNVISTTQNGTGGLFAGPGFRTGGGTQESVTITNLLNTTLFTFVMEVTNGPEEGIKKSELYLNGQLLRTTWLSNISNDKLVMVAMTTTAIVNATEFVDESIVKLKRVMIEEIPLP